ncbi:MAG: serine--tRNA ligase [Rhizobiales bacterium]|nr:serine--tRNA ligase [Hyphomicrobiales bacterium]NRB12835.1 serine--tRNA ligase [Hyphomicrobiales bacterium]
MHDIKWIRENPEAFEQAMLRRKLSGTGQKAIELDKSRRDHVAKLQELQTQRNDASKAIGKAKSQGDEVAAQAAIAKVADIKQTIKTGEEAERELTKALNDYLLELPNIMFDDVPDGADEDDNIEMHKVGTPKTFDFEAKQHFDIGEGLGLMDFEAAAKMSGSRFVVLKSELAQLERALANFMLDLHTLEYGREEVVVPLLVNENALYGTNQLPKFEADMFKTTDGKYLISTSEVSLTNLVRETTLNEADLPVRYTSYSNCFRSEAGSAGRDTRGMIRQHQFSKVEMVSVVHPDKSEAEQLLMLEAAELVLSRLGLAYRVVKLCTGDTGFGAKRTFDLEVWLPGQNMYREISSVSTCGDFQARRMSARFKPTDSQGAKKGAQFVHTLNGSGLAIGRTIVAILENYQTADGSVEIPKILQPYMGGKTLIKSK